MKVCVIGGGISGLCATRFLKNEPDVTELVVYEVAGQLGGTWVYTDGVGIDEFGAPINTSMYKSLRTNLPKQTMEFSGYEWAKEMSCFPRREQVMEYLKDFAKKEDLIKYIEFHTMVSKVVRLENKWHVTVKNFVNKIEKTNVFDGLFVCVGHYSHPDIPKYPGSDLYEGKIIHSHDYRIPEEFKNKTVLLVGLGASGADILLDLCRFTKKIYVSHRSTVLKTGSFPPSIVLKPEISKFSRTSVIFTDGSEVEVDTVLYCTGYQYYFPFLDASCGLEVTKYKIYPLYRHIVNVNQPTMFLLNTVRHLAGFPNLWLQAKYSVECFMGRFSLPTRDGMMIAIEEEAEENRKMGFKEKEYHSMLHRVSEYFNDLSSEAGIEKIPPVIVSIFKSDLKLAIESFVNFREYIYEIIDDHTFSRRLPGNETPEIITYGHPNCNDSPMEDIILNRRIPTEELL